MKLRSIDSFKRHYFCVAHLHGIVVLKLRRMYLGAMSVPPFFSLTSRELHEKLGVKVYVEDEHKNMKVIGCLKTFSFTDSPLVGYGIVYCILAMVTWFKEINILYFSDFSNLDIKASSFSTGFALLKLRSKDRIKRNHFCMSAS